jgi:hypothetical protein
MQMPAMQSSKMFAKYNETAKRLAAEIIYSWKVK